LTLTAEPTGGFAKPGSIATYSTFVSVMVSPSHLPHVAMQVILVAPAQVFRKV
jgi:hypothetical protein